MRTVVNGLAVRRAGAGAPVVLLHGSGTDSRLWDAVVPALAESYDVIRYDARGLGRSETPTGAFSDVSDLLAVLDALDLRQAALVGLSMGAETAVDFTLAHPGRVASLALVGASISGHDWPRTPELSVYDRARAHGPATVLARLELEIWAACGPAAPGGALIEQMVWDNATRRADAERYLGYPTVPAIDRLGQIGVPTLVVRGECDHPEIEVIARRLLADVPGATAAVIPDADHYLPLRTPQALLDVLLPHLLAATGP